MATIVGRQPQLRIFILLLAYNMIFGLQRHFATRSSPEGSICSQNFNVVVSKLVEKHWTHDSLVPLSATKKSAPMGGRVDMEQLQQQQS